MTVGLSIVLSAGFVGLVYMVTRGASAWPVCALSGMIAVAMFCLIPLFPILGLQAFITFVAACFCVVGDLRPRLVGVAAIAAVASHALAFLAVSNQIRVREALRDEFPLHSVADRLDYESQPVELNAIAEQDRAAVSLSEKVRTRLLSFEQSRTSSGLRARMLERLHEQTTADFVIARGFGMTRMSGVPPRLVELPEAEPITLPSPPEPFAYGRANAEENDTTVPDPQIVSRQPTRDTLISLHDFGVSDFLDRETIGYVKSLRYVAGFEPHQFSQVPPLESHEWQVTRLELISLLRHDEPVAYVSRNLPRMEELKHAPTRALDRFESLALDRLRAAEDIVVKEGLNRMRMVGSLRAARDCLSCHSVRRGELLGAFSYDITRVDPIPEPEPSMNDMAWLDATWSN